MQLESHCAVGWLIGNLVPGAGRRVRAIAVFSAMAPDLDGVAYAFGPDAYSRSHHVYGHNVFAGMVFTLFCVWLARPGWRTVVALVAGLGFASHWAGDYYLSGWPLMTFWPISHAEQMYRPRIGLNHPINQMLSYASLLFFVASIWFWHRTIFETVWPSMDRLLVGLTRPRTMHCAICQRRTAQSCSVCGKPLCLRHARISIRTTIHCPACSTAGPDAEQV